MLDELGTAVQDTIQELRELAHGIYPPLLVDSGLAGALRPWSTGARSTSSLSTEGIGRYAGDVEAAVYFCCLEALQNAGKHAADSHVTVRIWEESGGPAVRGHRRRSRFRRAHGPARAWIREHDGPPRRYRWFGPLGVEPGHGTAIRGSVPPAAEPLRQARRDAQLAKRPVSRSSQSRRSVFGLKCSLCM